MTWVEPPAVLAPVAGDPDEVLRMAAGLASEAELLAALSCTLRGLADPAVAIWASPADAAFGRRVGAVPGVLDRIGNRYGVAAAALRHFAGALRQAQAEVTRCQRLHEQEWPAFLRAGDQMALAETSGDPAGRLLAGRYRAEMVAHGERVQLAVRHHAAAHEACAAADRACAVVLRGLLDDGLADSRLYDALTGTGRAAAAVADVSGVIAMLPPARPLGVVATGAEGASLTADAAVLAVYGDGDLASLGMGVVAAAAGAAGPVLKAGARATNATAVSAAGTRAARRSLRLTTTDRLGAGLAATTPGVRPGVLGRTEVAMVGPATPRPAPRWTRPPRTAAALRPWLHEQTTVRTTTWAKARPGRRPHDRAAGRGGLDAVARRGPGSRRCGAWPAAGRVGARTPARRARAVRPAQEWAAAPLTCPVCRK
ncbi:hypothetical protein ABEG17_15075 [Pedococcus sp. KACC 23699]|uniref:DUF222 domain-containing protein n=1 Tax=Pedococcus sp. KACC 23699 TaxID=3149228 RepID=A0AAU7JRF6_9MICO